MKTKVGQKWLCGAGALAVCCMLTGCHMNHEWQEATCTTPKTCSVGGETEGEALGHTWVDAACSEPKHCSVCGETEGTALEHTWVDATCSAPKTCSVCGETEGKALEHTLTEANYQQPATCEVCGETVGEPLQAEFEKYGLVCNAELDTTYTVVTPCYENFSYTTEGKLTFSDYEIFEADDTHEALEGYEWRAVNVTIIFDDENARNYGANFAWIETDYYNDTEYFASYDENTDTNTVNYNGTDYTDVKSDSETLQSGWVDHILTEQARICFRVPKGYDGMAVTVVGYNASTWDDAAPLADNIDDDTVFFRMK